MRKQYPGLLHLKARLHLYDGGSQKTTAMSRYRSDFRKIKSMILKQLVLMGFLLTMASLALAALPISGDQTTNYNDDGLGLADTIFIANGTVIDDISYDGWRFNEFGGETGPSPYRPSAFAINDALMRSGGGNHQNTW